MAKCQPGCSCGRHQKHQSDCICGRCRVWAERRGKHERGCSCHLCQTCPVGCTCGKHRERAYSEDRQVTYFALHNRVRRARGSASGKFCVKCRRPALHWAQIKGTDGTDVHKHYQPMCPSCHQLYDRQGYVVSEETRQKLSAVATERWRKWREQKAKEVT